MSASRSGHCGLSSAVVIDGRSAAAQQGRMWVSSRLRVVRAGVAVPFGAAHVTCEAGSGSTGRSSRDRVAGRTVYLHGSLEVWGRRAAATARWMSASIRGQELAALTLVCGTSSALCTGGRLCAQGRVVMALPSRPGTAVVRR